MGDVIGIVECNEECLNIAKKFLEHVMGWYHSYFASSCIEKGICRVLVASDKEMTIGIIVFYKALTKPLPTIVIYYVAVDSKFRGRGVGKALVTSVESLFENNQHIFLATTRENNIPSRKLFSELNYSEAFIEHLDNRTSNFIERLACSYEDDVVLYKGISDIAILAHINENISIAERIWKRVCYEPWKQLRKI